MNAVLTTPEARPASLGSTSLIAASSTGLNAMPAPRPSRIMLGRTSTTKLPSTGARAKSTSPTAASSSPAASGALMPKRMTSLAERPSENAPMIRLAGRKARPTCERAVAEHQLEVERREEEPREHGRGPEHADDVRGRDVAQPEEAERHRAASATRASMREEERQQRRRAAPSRPSVCADVQPVLVAVHDRVDGEHQRGGHRHRAGDVEAAARRRPAAPPAAAAARGRRRATPIGTLTRKIQCQSSTSVRTPPRSTPMLPPPATTKPKTPIAFARSAGSVNRVMISESATAETTAPPSPCTARAATRSSCEFARPQRERGQREERDADQEQPPVAEEVAEPAAEQQEAAEGEQVGVHDPGERGLGEAEVLPDRRQRDVHDRRVEDDHQVAQAEDDQREPAGAAIRWSSASLLSGSVVVGLEG